MDTDQNFKSNLIEKVSYDIPEVMCHICNINVPFLYLKEHYKSVKHTTYMDITNSAIERTQKNTERRIFEIKNPNVLNSTYFCESCVKIVAIQDKNEHEKSKNHLQIIKTDNLLNELSKIYIGNDKTAIDKICIIKDEIQKYDKHNNITEKNTRKHNSGTVNRKDNKNVIGEDPKRIDNNAEIKIQKHNSGIINSKDNKNVTKKNVRQDIIKENDNNAEINGQKHNSDAINRKDNKKKVNNNIAEEIIDNLSDINLQVRKKIDPAVYIRIATIIYNTIEKNEPTTHLLKGLDERFIEIKIKDVEVRVLVNDFHGFKDMGQNRYACTLCDVVGINRNSHEHQEHIFTIKHIKRVMAPIKSTNFIRQVDDEWSHCIICNHLISNSSIRRNIHVLNNLEHTLRLERAIVTFNDRIRESGNREYKDIKRPNKNLQTYCNVCNIKISVNDMYSHRRGVRHTLNKNRKEKESVTQTNDNREFIASEKQDELYTENILTKDINRKASSNSEERESKEDQYKIDSKTISKEINDPVDEESTLESKANDSIDAELASESSDESVGDETDVEWETEQDKEEFIYHNNFARIDRDLVNCKLCNITLPTQKYIIKKHLKNANHKALYKSILILNRINVIDNDCYCEICEQHTKKGFVFEHILSVLHTNNKNALINNDKKVKIIGPITNDKDICNVCKVYIGASNMASHVKGKKHLAKGTERDTECYHCDICDVKFVAQSPQIEEHYGGERHNNNIKKVISDNKILVKDIGECFCETCEVNFSKLHLLKHIQSCNHIILLGLM